MLSKLCKQWIWEGNDAQDYDAFKDTVFGSIDFIEIVKVLQCKRVNMWTLYDTMMTIPCKMKSFECIPAPVS